MVEIDGSHLGLHIELILLPKEKQGDVSCVPFVASSSSTPLIMLKNMKKYEIWLKIQLFLIKAAILDAIFVLQSQKTIESITLSQYDTSVTIIDKICSEKFEFCTIQVLYFKVLTDDNPLDRHLEL